MTDIKRVPFINKVDAVSSFSLRVAIIIVSGTRVLMVKNEGKMKYKHVGGHVKLSESLYQGLKREISEEIGVFDFEYAHEPLFFDQVWINGDLMINSYFAVKVSDGDLERISNSTILPSKLFRFDELDKEVTYDSEIKSLKYYLSISN